MIYDTLLIDGNNLAHRCRHVFHLSNRGIDVSVTFGVLHNISSLIHRFKPKSIIVCWDGGVPEFRRVAIPSYKANREHGDPLEYEDFIRQLNELCDFVFPTSGIISIRKIGAEADDLIAHTAQMLSGNTLVITNDKDLYQTVSKNVHMLNPTKDIIVTPDNFEEIVGISQKHYVDWRAIQGDSSDNIPGVPGIGDKTATKLFQEFKELTNITNAAAGHYPHKHTMSDKLATSILSFGFETICKNIYITALYADRVGAKLIIQQSINSFRPANKDRLKKYLLRNAFITMQGEFMPYTVKLIAPTIRSDDFRMPMICAKRTPVL
jgi:DNA polymerase-1